MYYCLECEKHIEEQEGPLFECPTCQQNETLYKINATDTEVLQGKTIQSVCENVWKDISRLIIFTDGTHAAVTHPYSDEIDIELLEHDYGDEIDDEDEE